MGLETIGLVASIGSAVMGAGSALMTGIAQSQAASYQAAVARNNQIIAGQNANYARQAAAADAAKIQQRTAGLIGSERAAQGANGLDVNSGSNLDVQASTYALGKLDVTNRLVAGEREAYGYNVQGMNAGAAAGLYDYAAGTALWGGVGNAFGSLIGGASGVAGKWANFQNAGLLSGGSSGGSGYVDQGTWT